MALTLEIMAALSSGDLIESHQWTVGRQVWMMCFTASSGQVSVCQLNGCRSFEQLRRK
jgi:hypothetical protein